MNSGYEQPAGPTVFMIFGPNLSSNIIKLYMDGFCTQRDFHRVKEHLKRSSDEEIMTVRNWKPTIRKMTIVSYSGCYTP